MSEGLPKSSRLKEFVKKKGLPSAAVVLLVTGCSAGNQDRQGSSLVLKLTGDCIPGKKGRSDLPPISYGRGGGEDFYIRAGEDGAFAKVNVKDHSFELAGETAPDGSLVRLYSAPPHRVVFELEATDEEIKPAAVCE